MRGMIGVTRRAARRAIDRAERGVLRVASLATGPTGPLRGHYDSAAAAARARRGQYVELDPANGFDPPTFVAVLPRAHVIYSNGMVVTDDRRLVADVSAEIGAEARRHGLLRTVRLPRPTYVRGRLAVVSHWAQQVYYHWLLDALPRLDILRRTGIPYDHLYTNVALPFQRETLLRAGVDLATVVHPEPRDRLHFQADHLVVPALPGGELRPSRHAVRFLRSLFGTAADAPVRRLYVSRADASARRVRNESALIDALIPLGFEPVTLAGRTVEQQADLFASAHIVCGPHGAGFTNVAFCQPGAALVELMPSGYQVQCFETLAAAAGVRYSRLVVDDTPTESSIDPGRTHDMVADIPTVLRAVRAVLGS